MVYSCEEDMYLDVGSWLERFLKERHRNAAVNVYDASRKSLVRLITDVGLQDKLPPEWVSWDIHVDIVGTVCDKDEAFVAFVECKFLQLNLRDLSQLLGYSLIARPRYSFLLSPQGPSDSLRSLIKTYNRMDVLRYHQDKGRLPRAIVIGKWLEETRGIDLAEIISDDSAQLGLIGHS